MYLYLYHIYSRQPRPVAFIGLSWALVLNTLSHSHTLQTLCTLSSDKMGSVFWEGLGRNRIDTVQICLQLYIVSANGYYGLVNLPESVLTWQQRPILRFIVTFLLCDGLHKSTRPPMGAIRLQKNNNRMYLLQIYLLQIGIIYHFTMFSFVMDEFCLWM